MDIFDFDSLFGDEWIDIMSRTIYNMDKDGEVYTEDNDDIIDAVFTVVDDSENERGKQKLLQMA